MSTARITAWQLALLIALVVLRQFLNAMPLVYFIDDLSVFKATASDQGATLMSMIAPPTTDSVFRIMVLRSWGVDIDRAAAGGTSNILVFYIARWISPPAGSPRAGSPPAAASGCRCGAPACSPPCSWTTP